VNQDRTHEGGSTREGPEEEEQVEPVVTIAMVVPVKPEDHDIK
jgi:hypothetical protein